MAENQEPVTGAGEPKGEPEPAIDYKAKYDELLRHSREWERKAKANKAAADELEALKASQMSDVERIQKQLEEQKARADALQAERDRAAWVAEVSEETGVPADLLSFVAAESKEDLAEKAAKLSERYAEKPAQTVPVVLGGSAPVEPGSATASDFIRDQYRKMHR